MDIKSCKIKDVDIIFLSYDEPNAEEKHDPQRKIHLGKTCTRRRRNVMRHTKPVLIYLKQNTLLQLMVILLLILNLCTLN